MRSEVVREKYRPHKLSAATATIPVAEAIAQLLNRLSQQGMSVEDVIRGVHRPQATAPILDSTTSDMLVGISLMGSSSARHSWTERDYIVHGLN